MKHTILLLIFILSLTAKAQSSFEKGEVFFENEKWAAATNNFEQVKSSSQHYLKAQEYLGDVASKQEKWEEAVDFYEVLVEAKPKNANYNFKYGGALGMKALQLTKVEAMFYISDIKHYLKEAARLDKNHIEARWALVKLYMQLPSMLGGSSETSYQYAEELQHISPVDGWLAKGYIAVEDKDYEKAEKYYKNALKVGGSILCYKKLIHLYQEKTQETQKAKNLLAEAKKVHPRHDWTVL